MNIKLSTDIANCKSREELCEIGDKHNLKITEVKKKLHGKSVMSFEYPHGKPFRVLVNNVCL